MSPDLPSYEQAAALVAAHARKLARQTKRRTERVPLASALNRILAAPIAADDHQPPFARSTRDGYACSAGHDFPCLAIGERASGRLAGVRGAGNGK